jgi:hypothetical protein
MIYTIFDLEIIKAIPPYNDADRFPKIEYCQGWKDFENMDISVWALCELDTETWTISESIHGHDVMDLIDELNDRDLAYPTQVGGFNVYSFDDKLVKAQGYNFGSDFDIFQMILEAAGLKGVEYWEQDPKPCYKLSSICDKNGQEKTLTGELAAIYWQQGRRQKVIDYCKNDVRIEAEILKLLLQGELIDPNTGNKLLYPIPGIASIV